MSAVELTVLPVSDQCKGLLGSDSIWWRPRSKCSPDAAHDTVGPLVRLRTLLETSLMTLMTAETEEKMQQDPPDPHAPTHMPRAQEPRNDKYMYLGKVRSGYAF